MSGGVLTVMDRSGRATRRIPLVQGLATVGRSPDNDIRIIRPEVAPHHATILILDGQAEVRSSGGVTLVNGGPVGVEPLHHGDMISVGGRELRWEYTRPRAAAPRLPSPAGERVVSARRGRGRERRSAPGPGLLRDRAVQLAVEMAHRASMPGSTGGKQVAVVQPRRRDAVGTENAEKSPARASPQTTRRHNEPTTSFETEDKSKRKSTARASPKNFLQNTTKATLWIESRKTSPRRKVQTTPQIHPARRSLPNKKTTPLRMTVLKKAQSAYKTKVIKIEAPLKIDHTKQAAIMLMTGHTPKSKLSITPKTKSSSKKSPSYLVKKSSPVRKTSRGKSGRSGRGSKATGSDIGVTPTRGSNFALQSANRRSNKRNSERSVSILEIADSTQNLTARSSRSSGKSPRSPLPSPKKSAMKDRSKKSLRKTESIKFDLSNLENHRDSDMAATVSTRYESDESEDITLRYSESSVHSQSPSPRRSIHSRSGRMLVQVGMTLTPTPTSPSRSLTSDSPSGRRSLRGSAMVQRVMEASSVSDRTRSDLSANMTASDRTKSDLSAMLATDRTRSRLTNSIASDRTRSDLSAMLATDRTRSRLTNSIASDRTRSDLSAMLATDRTRSRLTNSIASDRTRSDLSVTLAPDRTRSRLSANSIASDRTRSDLSVSDTKSRLTNASLASAFRTRTLSPRHNLESYSVVDLVSFDSEDPTKSVYDSADSTNASDFGTPAGSGRKTRSTIEPVLLSSSTPYFGRDRQTRSKSSSITMKTSVVSTRRSKSLTTPENGQPVVVTIAPRASRPSRSRSRIHDDLSILDLTEPDDSSPRTSKRSRTNVSETIDISNVDLGDKEVGIITPENRRSPEMEGTPVLSIRSLLDSSRGSVSRRSGKDLERESVALTGARRSRLRLSREQDEGIVTPISAAKPTPESVKNKHSTAKKPQSKRSIIDDLNQSDIVKQLFDSPVKRKLTQSMSEFSRKRIFEDEDDRPARRPTRRTLATAPSAPLLLDTRAGGDSRRAKRKSAKNDLTDVRGVKAIFREQPKDDLRRVTGVGSLFRKKSPRNDLSDVRGVRKMFQQKSPNNDLRNVSGVKRVLATSPRNDLTDVRGVRRMFKGEKRKASYQDVSGIEELFQSRDLSEELFDTLVGRPPIRAVYSRTFTGREASRPKTRRRSLRTSFDVNNVEEWLEKELRRHLPSEPSASRRVTMELRKLATDTSEGIEQTLPLRTRNVSYKSSSVARGGKGSPSVASPARGPPPAVSPARPPCRALQRAVHSTPLKGRLQLTMNASELGRVSPIAGPSRDYPQVDRDCFVSMSTQTDEEIKEILGRFRSPRKQKSPKKMELLKPSPSVSKIASVSGTLEKSTRRATRNRKVSETAPANTRKNTRRRRSSLVVTKKAPIISPTARPKALTANSKNPSPKPGKSGTRTRAAKPILVIGKPSPKPKPRRGVKAEPSQTEQVKRRVTRKVTEKKPASPKPSPKGKKQTRAKASKIEPQTKARKTKVEELAAVEQPKRTRRKNAVEPSVGETSSDTVIQTRRGKVASKPEVEKKQPNSRGKKAQNQTSAQTEMEEKRPNVRGKKVQTQTNVQSETEEKKTSARGRKAQTQTSVQPESEEKRSNTRGKKVQFEIDHQGEPTRRGRKKQEENIPKPRGNTAQSPPSVQPQPRGRKAKADVTPTVKPDVAPTETRRGKRKAARDLSDSVPQPKRGRTETPAGKATAKQKGSVSKDDKVANKQETTKSLRATRSKPVEEPEKQDTTRARGRKAAEPKEKVAVSTRGKRKANVNPSLAKAAGKKAAPEQVAPAPAPASPQQVAPRARRAVRPQPLPEAPTVRGRRR